MKKALILVDIQNDFVPGGALAVPDGNQVIPVANRIMKEYDLVVATRDWHPAGHQSFASQHAGKNIGDVVELEGLQQILWPDHCIQGARGSELVAELNKEPIDKVVFKGTHTDIDSYSGFFDNGRREATGLGDYLKDKAIRQVDIMGLATDYCVKFTALDAVGLGFTTNLILAGCRGVEINPGDCQKAIKEMEQAGVIIRKVM